MNGFRLIGDILHLFAITLLLQKIWVTRSCNGVSGKSQILFAMVFTTRYLDLFTTYISLYNTVMKLVYIIATYIMCYLIYYKFKETYDRKRDTFCIELLLLASIALALNIHYDFTLIEICWSFSVFVEYVAILPQLLMIYKAGEVERTTLNYLCALTFYILFYILNWIYRYMEFGHYDKIRTPFGIAQFLIFCSFFVYQWLKGIKTYSDIGQGGGICKINTISEDLDKRKLKEDEIARSQKESELILSLNEYKNYENNLKLVAPTMLAPTHLPTGQPQVIWSPGLNNTSNSINPKEKSFLS